jgi:predicted DNA-binding transcriptional regulator AlpA
MKPSARREVPLADPGTARLGDAIASPDPCPQCKRGATLPASFEPLLSIDDLALLLSCSRRLVERMRSGGKVPKPDIKIGKMPRWKASTIRAWIERGGRP